jgi:hypothetical protein
MREGLKMPIHYDFNEDVKRIMEELEKDINEKWDGMHIVVIPDYVWEIIENTVARAMDEAAHKVREID